MKNGRAATIQIALLLLAASGGRGRAAEPFGELRTRLTPSEEADLVSFLKVL